MHTLNPSKLNTARDSFMPCHVKADAGASKTTFPALIKVAFCKCAAGRDTPKVNYEVTH